MQEEWKDIRDYEGLYQISNKGNVKSLGNNKTKKEKILKSSVNKRGYLDVKLCKNGKHKNFRINRLVAEAFISNPNNLPQVNHKNEIKDDNRVENLEWCDAKYNNNFGTRKERVAEKLSKPVLQINKTTNEIISEFPSTIEVKRQLGISHISECCLGKRNTAGGYKWQYK